MSIAAVLLFVVLAIVWLSVMALLVVGTAAWVWLLIEVVRLPEHQFRAAGTEKSTWVLVVVLAGQIGAAIWFFTQRKKVLALSGVPAPPVATPAAGWYPEPGTGQIRWWDGQRWGDYGDDATRLGPGDAER